jgi:hypothetical protein
VDFYKNPEVFILGVEIEKETKLIKLIRMTKFEKISFEEPSKRERKKIMNYLLRRYKK